MSERHLQRQGLDTLELVESSLSSLVAVCDAELPNLPQNQVLSNFRDDVAQLAASTVEVRGSLSRLEVRGV